MKKISMFGLCLSALLKLYAFDVTVVPDHTNYLYRCGEEAVFTITAKNNDGSIVTNGFLDVTLDNFGKTQVGKNRFNLADGNPVTMKGALPKPGFLRVRAGNKLSSCGFDVDKIKPGAAIPNDFDEFWAKAMKNIEETVPLDPIVTPVPEKSTKDYTLSRVSFATVKNRRVYGWLSVPTDKTKAPFPVRVQVPGAGCATWSNNPIVAKDAICLLMTVFPFEPDTDLKVVREKYDVFQKEISEKFSVKECWAAGLGREREDFFYYPVILGINRAINWVAERPDVNLKHFTYSGISQGGGFGFYLMGLNKHFTKGCAFVPALTDLLTAKGDDRDAGWPKVISRHNEKSDYAQIEKNAPYFDGANFASRIMIPIRVVVGFADTTCPPCAVYAGYNAIPSKDKEIFHGIDMGHGVYGKFFSLLGEWQKK